MVSEKRLVNKYLERGNFYINDTDGLSIHKDNLDITDQNFDEQIYLVYNDYPNFPRTGYIKIKNVHAKSINILIHGLIPYIRISNSNIESIVIHSNNNDGDVSLFSNSSIIDHLDIFSKSKIKELSFNSSIVNIFNLFDLKYKYDYMVTKYKVILCKFKCYNNSHVQIPTNITMDSQIKYLNANNRTSVNFKILLDNDHFKFNDEGMIVYKCFGHTYRAPKEWVISKNSILRHVVDGCIENSCSYGINVGSKKWITNNANGFEIWKCVIPFHELINIVVPDNSNGKIRTPYLKLLNVVNIHNE